MIVRCPLRGRGSNVVLFKKASGGFPILKTEILKIILNTNVLTKERTFRSCKVKHVRGRP